MPIANDAKIIYAHYLTGLYPDAGTELPDPAGVGAAGYAELVTARCLGAHHRGLCHQQELLPCAAEVADMVARLLDAPAAPVKTLKHLRNAHGYIGASVGSYNAAPEPEPAAAPDAAGGAQ